MQQNALRNSAQIQRAHTRYGRTDDTGIPGERYIECPEGEHKQPDENVESGGHADERDVKHSHDTLMTVWGTWRWRTRLDGQHFGRHVL